MFQNNFWLIYLWRNYQKFGGIMEELLTRKEYENVCKVSKRTAARDLNDLMKKKIIRGVGKGPSLYYILLEEMK